jgi:hypothetical protein
MNESGHSRDDGDGGEGRRPGTWGTCAASPPPARPWLSSACLPDLRVENFGEGPSSGD